ncbi:MAG: hypothetical protein J4F31_05030 [Flavobacteriales bacterium]|nr:hypothetical protein [Flavobacteriales bacterium]
MNYSRIIIVASVLSLLVACTKTQEKAPEILKLDDLYLDITLEWSITTPNYVYLVVAEEEWGDFAPVELNDIDIYYNGEYQDSPFIYECDCPSKSKFAYRFNFDPTDTARIDLVQDQDTLTQIFPVQNWEPIDFRDDLDSLYMLADFRLSWSGKGVQIADDSVRVLMTTPSPDTTDIQMITELYRKHWYSQNEITRHWGDGYLSLFQINRFTSIPMPEPTSKGGKARMVFESRRIVKYFR